MAGFRDRVRSLFSSTAEVELPEFPPIYQHIRSHIPTSAPGLRKGGETLPDDEYVREEKGVAWVAGGLDGAFSRHGAGSGADQRRLKQLHSALTRVADRPGPAARASLKRLFVDGDPRSDLGELLNLLQQKPPRNQQRLYDEMKELATTTGHRGVAKFALLILSAFGNPEDAELFTVFGRHEEFTFYAALALSNVLDDPRPGWLHMARNVRGWGRIELTELLLDSESPESEVCDFLLRDGASNDIMNEYTAVPIATKCSLHEALESEEDPALLRGAAVIIRALADGAGGGPAGGMTDYPHSGLAVERFLGRFESEANSLDDYLVAKAIQSFAGGDHDEDALAECGWSPDRRERIASACSRVLDRPEWHERAMAGLDSREYTTHFTAMAVARDLGIPLRAHIKERLEGEPLSNLWFDLVNGANQAEMDEALEMASRLLDLDAIATGPADELGLGSEFQLHGCADWLLQELSRFPGRGWEVIRPALRSPVVRNRNMALRALGEWPPELLTTEIREVLAECANDPVEDVRAKCREIVGSVQG